MHRIQFRHAVSSPDLLERLLPRFRQHFTPETVLLAGAVEERLSEDTWASSETYDLLEPLREPRRADLVLHGEDDHIPQAVAVPRGGSDPAAPGSWCCRTADTSRCWSSRRPWRAR